jgi:hypothetical protein
VDRGFVESVEDLMGQCGFLDSRKLCQQSSSCRRSVPWKGNTHPETEEGHTEMTLTKFPDELSPPLQLGDGGIAP